MIRENYAQALNRITSLKTALETESPQASDLELLLSADSEDEHNALLSEARKIRNMECGERMLLRGLVEFSSICCNSCYYCGLNKNNQKAGRYHLSADEVISTARQIADAGIQTIVLQSGEDGTPTKWLTNVIKQIKKETGIAVTLSVGERPRSDYEEWRKAGADRYLLRIESTNPKLYYSLHENRSVETRLRCLSCLQDLGYQTGSGLMVGVPGQSISNLARDIKFFYQSDFDMIGIGPFLPHPDTPLGKEPAGNIPLTLRVIALVRIVTGNAWMPTTTALGSMDTDYRVHGLNAGANVFMPCFTPAKYRKQYAIYPGKQKGNSYQDSCPSTPSAGYEELASKAGLQLDWGRGDSLKTTFQI